MGEGGAGGGATRGSAQATEGAQGVDTKAVPKAARKPAKAANRKPAKRKAKRA